jgi:hypothetical protein
LPPLLGAVRRSPPRASARPVGCRRAPSAGLRAQLLESTDDIEGLCELSAGKGPGRGGESGSGCCTEAEYALTEIAIEAYSSRLEFLGDEVRRSAAARTHARRPLD